MPKGKQKTSKFSSSEENYIKAVYALCSGNEKVSVGTSAIADRMQTKAASATDMIVRLSQKDLLHYEKYQGVKLTPLGKDLAIKLIRKHRLWEVFLSEKLNFNWDEVHEVAEQLEHIQSEQLVERLDGFLGHPKFDPHGDPIPDKTGVIIRQEEYPLNSFALGEQGKVVAVNDSSDVFLKFLDKKGISLGTELQVLEFFDYDGSLEVQNVNNKEQFNLSKTAAENVMLKKEE